MKKLLTKSLFFVLLLLGSILGVFLLEGGYSDQFYQRFTTPKQGSLVLGTSRAAQGIIPSILNQEIGSLTTHPFYNYAFTLANSPYGEVYLSSIKRKVSDSHDGIFLLAVDPWSIATSDSIQQDFDLPERQNFLANVENVSINPNLQYLLNYYPGWYANIIGSRLGSHRMVLHEDGWLEVNISMKTAAQTSRMHKTLNRYKKKDGNYHISKTRLDFLCQTIEFLKGHGRIFMIRIPIGEEMKTLEDVAMPDFAHKMDSVSLKYEVPFLDMSSQTEGLRFTDIHHLHSHHRQNSLEN